MCLRNLRAYHAASVNQGKGLVTKIRGKQWERPQIRGVGTWAANAFVVRELNMEINQADSTSAIALQQTWG